MQLRIAIVTRRFWPLVGGIETLAASLATEWRRLGCDVRIVTAQSDSHWNTEFFHCEIPVERVPKPPQIGWGMFRYMLALGRWLRRKQGEFDLIYVMGLQQEAYVSLEALSQTKIPVVLRAHRAGPRGDVAWQERASFGSRIRRRCISAPAIVYPTTLVKDELQQAGFDSDRLHQIPNGTPTVAMRDRASMLNARGLLASSNADLAVDPDAPLAVYVGRLDSDGGLENMLRAWRPIVEESPNARLWLIGEGPARDDLYDVISDCDLRYRVHMPGTIDEPHDVFLAADLFLFPSQQSTQSLAILEAMMAGVPVVAADVPMNREAVMKDSSGWLVAPRSEKAWTQAMHEALYSQDLRAQYIANAREQILESHSIEMVAEEHLRLFRQLVA